ncbi:MAG: hypothetical protein AABZ47_10840, partial [Planctomycetota bacterium]
EVQEIRIFAPGEALPPTDDDGTPRPTPTDETADSAANRPGLACGLGMFAALIGNLFGLGLMLASRRFRQR